MIRAASDDGGDSATDSNAAQPDQGYYDQRQTDQRDAERVNNVGHAEHRDQYKSGQQRAADAAAGGHGVERAGGAADGVQSRSAASRIDVRGDQRPEISPAARKRALHAISGFRRVPKSAAAIQSLTGG